MKPEIIQRKSLAEDVASKLQERILKGNYKINQKLPVESELMKNFGVGRSTVREAVKILANSGFLRVKQGIGTFIDDVTGINEPLFQKLKRSDSQCINEVRQLLEMKIAEKAAINRTGNDISKLEHFLKKRTKAAYEDAIEESIDAHINFYIVLAEASKNDILADLYKLFALQMKEELRSIHADTTYFKDSPGHHNKLLDSVLRQDARNALYWSGQITGQMQLPSGT
jgi:DNA-binding FadR family transcriptional regulator